MSYLLVCDSCTDLNKEIRNDCHIVCVPLTLHIGDYDVMDDDTFDQKDFLKRIAEYPECPKSSCPSPEKFMEHYDKADDIYVITLSNHLSGSYNSAMLAREMYFEEHGNKNIHVFDSLSASAGQTLVALEIKKRIDAGMDFEKIVEEVELFIKSMGTKFVLETLEILRKNGRLSNVTAMLVNALNIKLVMSSDGNGQVEKYGQARGMKKAIEKMAQSIKDSVVNPENRTLVIAQCNNIERAELVKKVVTELVPFKDVVIVPTAGISSLYAADGGIVVAY